MESVGDLPRGVQLRGDLSMPARRRPTRRALDLRNLHVRAVLGDRGWGRRRGRPGGPVRLRGTVRLLGGRSAELGMGRMGYDEPTIMLAASIQSPACLRFASARSIA